MSFSRSLQPVLLSALLVMLAVAAGPLPARADVEPAFTEEEPPEGDPAFTPDESQRMLEDGAAFAVAHAPEAALEVCAGNTVDEAIACARAACVASSGLKPGDCLIVTACENGNWKGVMGIMLGETHFSTAICGAPSREGALKELRARCRAYLPYQLRECYVWRLYSPYGEIEEVELGWSLADFGAGTDEEEDDRWDD